MTAYLVTGLSLSFGQNEEKPETMKSETSFSEKVEKQGDSENSEPNSSKFKDKVGVITAMINIREIGAGIAELNGREALAWGNEMIKGYTDDASIFQNLDQSLGRNYVFSGTVSGGHIAYAGSEKVALKRTPSSVNGPGVWETVLKKQKDERPPNGLDNPETKDLEELLSDMSEGAEKVRLSKIVSRFKRREIDAGIAELNSREALAWGNNTLSSKGFTDDATVFKAVDQTLGDAYSFNGTVSGGHVIYKGGEKVILKRTPSSAKAPGFWERASKKPSKKD